MQFDEIRDRIEALCKLGGWSNSDPLPNYAQLANIGLRRFTEVAQHNIEETTISTVNGTAEYSLLTADDQRGWVLIFDDATYTTTRRMYQTSASKLRREDRMWRQKAAGTTSRWFIIQPNVVRLYPPPDTTADTVYFSGIRHEPVMDADSDEPLAPEIFHEGICLYGAWHHGKLYARGEERAIVTQYLQEAKAFADACKAERADQDAPILQRRVSRSVPDYLVLTTYRSTTRDSI